jgi:multiple antibiotic resistance protein
MEAELTKSIAHWIALFSIVDPLSAVPLFLALTQGQSAQVVNHIRAKAVLVATGILFAFSLLGNAIFSFFGITSHAFQIAGGVLLFIVGMQQVNANDHKINEDEKMDLASRGEVAIFPLAFPILSGPGAMSVVILQSSRNQTFWDQVFQMLGIALVMASAFVSFALAHQLKRLLGQTGLNIIMRLGGVILIAIAVQFVLDGVQGYLKVLAH